MRYGALEYAYAAPIAEALAKNREFRAWILNRTKFINQAGSARLLADEMKARRSSAAADWWRSHYSQKCPCDGCRGQETDLLAIFELGDGRRIALHFEVKQPTDVFHAGQGRAYSHRASCWVRQPPRAILPHDDAATVLLCSALKLAGYGQEADAFGSIITFEQIAAAFPGILPPALVAVLAARAPYS